MGEVEIDEDRTAAAHSTDEKAPATVAPLANSKANTSSSSNNEELKPAPPHGNGPQTPTTRAGADAALQLLRETGGLGESPTALTTTTTAAAADLAARRRRLVRKIDLRVMPLICTVYFLQYIDKTAISYASVTGLPQSTNLQGSQFNWVASIFFFGQLAFEFPTVRLVQRFPLAKYAAANVALWGVVLACLAACRSYAGLLVCRFVLGALEAAVVPAVSAVSI